MRLKMGRSWPLRMFAVLILVLIGVATWIWYRQPESLVPIPRVSQSFPATGVKTVVLRAAFAPTVEVAVDPLADLVEVSGAPFGGAAGYHSPDPSWRETPAAEWGLDFVAERHGDVLVISTKNEIEYIHHHYSFRDLRLRIPGGVEVVREPRQLTGDGAPDLKGPTP